MFSTRAFRAGELIRHFELSREVTPDQPLHSEKGERPEHCTWIDGRLFLVASPDRHFNHSCDPNAYVRFAADAIEVIARRRIEEGEELTLDYLINNSGGDSWPCHCGAARCRGETARSFFHLPVGVQREYLPLLAAWFVKRHSQEVAQLADSAP